MLASINDLGNILIYTLIGFSILAMLGVPVPGGMFLCNIILIVVCYLAQN
jgi:hypothetical protein